MNLDTLTTLARTPAAWDEPRAARVLGATLRRREQDLARGRTYRRALLAAAGAAAIVLLLLRASPQSTDPQLAQATLDDAGYTRD